MNKMFNKKGLALAETIHMIYRFGYAIFVIAMVILIIKLIVFTNLETDYVEMDVFSQRILHSKNIMYELNGRAYPGIIDLGKFESANIDKEINYMNKNRISAKINISNIDTTPVKQVYANEELWKKLIVVYRLEGPGGGQLVEKNFPIQYYKDGKFHEGVLFLSVLRQND